MKKYKKGLKRQGYKVVKRKFPNKKKRTCFNCGSTEHFIAKCPYETKTSSTRWTYVHLRSKTTSTRGTRKRTTRTIERARSTWERLTLGMNGTQLERSQEKRMRRLQP
jgi:hypothetical protein